MAQNSMRSMNDDMRIGAVEGRLRFLRPGTANPELEEAMVRSSVLATMLYGEMGVTHDNRQAIASVLPGSVHPLQPLRISKHDVVDPL